jgi:hypothetical protein
MRPGASVFSINSNGVYIMSMIASIIVMLLAIGMIWVSQQDFESAEQEFKFYCEMIDLHEKTDGEQGWPDYENLKKSCNEESGK